MNNYELLNQEIDEILEEINDIHIIESSLDDTIDFKPIDIPL